MIRIFSVVVLFASLALLATGQYNAVKSKTPVLTTRTVTIDLGEKQSADAVSIDPADSDMIYEHADITDWLDNDTIVYSLQKWNSSYPLGLYLKNVLTGEETPLRADADYNYEGAAFSPDRRYVAYIRYAAKPPEYGGVDMNLVVMNRQTGKENLVSENMRDYHWVDNDRILYDGWDATYLAEIGAQTINLTELTGRTYHNGADLIGENLYFIERAATSPVGGDLYMVNLSTGERRLIKAYVETFAPSPDGTQAVALLRPNEGVSRLSILSPEGKELAVLARREGAVLMRAWWSPDQRTIAYSVVSGADDSRNGLYLYDVGTGQSQRIAGDMHDPFVAWNPSGDRLSVSSFINTYHTSQVIDVKASQNRISK